jgi:hypothetical protein
MMSPAPHAAATLQGDLGDPNDQTWCPFWTVGMIVGVTLGVLAFVVIVVVVAVCCCKMNKAASKTVG